MQAPSMSPNFRSRCWGFLASRTRLQLAVVLLVVWVGGLYIGSSSKLNFTTEAYQVVRQADKPQFRYLIVSNISVTRYQNTTSAPIDASSTRNLSRASTPQAPVLTTEPPSRICHFPEIDPFDPAMEKYLKRYPPLNCSSNVPNVVRLNHDEITINTEKVKEALAKTNSSGKLGFCQYKVLRRKSNSDHKAEVVSTSARFNTSIKINKTDEDIKVACYDTQNKTISQSYFAIIRIDSEKERIYDDSFKVHIDKHSPAETLSVLMIGIDGFAKQHFARAMPKTRNFLVKELGALEMNKHIKLGYSTSPNVIPLLTGRTNDELRDNAIWRFQSRGWMDQINEAFVWSDARRLGYRTGLIFDQAYITAFHYLRKGFQRRPVDHYLRSTVMDAEGDAIMRKKNKNCYGDEPEVSKLYDYWLQLLHHYNSTKSNQTPFFAYSFLARLTHDNYNLAFAGDEMYLKVLQDLKATNALNNTVIIWFSDHGERYGSIRHTFTGEVETNTPYLFFAFPPWFEKKYPEVMRVFRTNQNRLTSHFDTYATMQDLLNFQGVVGPKGNRGERAISLFREIPEDRTCEDAQIPAEYCLCSGFSPAELSPGLDKYLGTVMTERIMSLLGKQKENCTTLRLKAVERVLKETQSEQDIKSGIGNFRVSIMTVPGEAQFEARMSFDSKSNKAKVVGEVARTNMYRGQADCVDTPELRRYCYCKNLLSVKAK